MFHDLELLEIFLRKLIALNNSKLDVLPKNSALLLVDAFIVHKNNSQGTPIFNETNIEVFTCRIASFSTYCSHEEISTNKLLLDGFCPLYNMLTFTVTDMNFMTPVYDLLTTIEATKLSTEKLQSSVLK